MSVFYAELKPGIAVRFVYSDETNLQWDLANKNLWNIVLNMWYEASYGNIDKMIDRTRWERITNDQEQLKEFVLAKIGAVHIRDL
jgi:hypothetical protein